jgi:hypothetical protein
MAILQVLPDKVIDGKAIRIQPTNPTKEYLAWWAEHGERSAGLKDSVEDGEAAGEVEEEAKELEAMEEVMDIITRRDQNGASRSAVPRRQERDATDRILDNVMRPDHKCVTFFICS